jgi:hypothetical protein
MRSSLRASNVLRMDRVVPSGAWPFIARRRVVLDILALAATSSSVTPTASWISRKPFPSYILDTYVPICFEIVKKTNPVGAIL